MSQQEELCNNDKVQQAHSVYNTKQKKHKLTHAPPPINNNINLKQLQRTRVFRNAWHKIDDPVVPFDSWF